MSKRMQTLNCRKINPRKLFSYVTAGCVLLLFLEAFFFRETFWTTFFFHGSDELGDTGMDFFNSLACAKERKSYSNYAVLYPPLANLFFWVLLKCIPQRIVDAIPYTFPEILDMRITGTDLRSFQAPLMLFLLFLLCVVLATCLLTEKFMERGNAAKAVSVSVLFSYGWLYGMERGNVVLLVMALVLFFFLYMDAKNRLLRELALVALAIAAGMKLYPAMFGLLLLCDRRYKEALRCAVYGVLLFFLPFFAFEGVDGVRMFFHSFLAHTQMETGVNTAYSLQAMSTILKTFGVESIVLNESLAWAGKGAVLLLCVGAFFSKSQWRRTLLLGVAVLEVQNGAAYGFLMLLPALLMLLREEQVLRRTNVIPFVLLLAVTVPLPLFGALAGAVSVKYLTQVLFYVLLLIWCVGASCGLMFWKRKGEKPHGASA